MRYRISIIIILAIFIISIVTLIIFLPKQERDAKEICFNKNCFKIEIAKTDEEKARGLMFRESLGENEGMLFIFDKQEDHYFWMKNTLISLDLIGLDKNIKITSLKENFLPCKQEPCEVIILENSKYVLEINSGAIEKLGLVIGNVGELK